MEDEGAGVEGTDGEKVPDHAPLVTKGHSIGLQSKNTEVTFNFPRVVFSYELHSLMYKKIE